MTAQSNIFVGLAGYVGRPDEKGDVGIFRRSTSGGAWSHVLKDLETYTVHVHGADANIVLAGTQDGVYRSTDGGASFTRTDFPDTKKQIWCFLVDNRDPKRIFAGGSPVDGYRSDDMGASWRKLPNPGLADRCAGPRASRVIRTAEPPTRPR